MLRNTLLGAAALAALAGSQADAAIMISSNPTVGFTCTSGVCTANAQKANLNIGDLVSMLAASDITVANGPLTKDIDVVDALSWASPHSLTLDSRRAINVRRPISVTGGGGLSLTLNDTGGNGPSNGLRGPYGALTFLPGGAITFLDTSSHFSIGNATYTLVADLQTLASDIEAQPTGLYALANSYNAGPDGVYADDPVPTDLQGVFEGLGNTISGLKIKFPASGSQVGLFHGLDRGSAVKDLHLKNVRVAGGKHSSTGALSGLCEAALSNITVSGKVSGAFESNVGGVCGVIDATAIDLHSSGMVTGTGDNGTIQSNAGGVAGSLPAGLLRESSSTAQVTGAKGWTVGGLVGQSTQSSFVDSGFATGFVSTGDNGTAGGLVGSSNGAAAVGNSYATGFVIGGVGSTAGGLIGLNDGPVSASYSSGPVASGSGNAVGGFIGNDTGASDLTDTYFDIDTSGQSHGVGSNTGYPGITALTTAQFQAGLPTGFSATVWVETPGIDNGLPTLLLNPQ
jgi:hypothetical protein